MGTRVVGEYEIESREFVHKLKIERRLSQDQGAWKILRDTYASMLAEVVASALLKYNLPDNLRGHVLEETWSLAQRQIKQLEFMRVGDLFKWLSATIEALVEQEQSHIDSEAFINLLKAGDHQAWDYLVNFYNDYLLTLGRRYLATKNMPLDAAPDLVSETWIKAHQRIGTIQFVDGVHTSGRLLAWLCVTLKKNTQNYGRKLKVRKKRTTPLEDQYDLLETIPSSAELRPDEEQHDADRQYARELQVLVLALARLFNLQNKLDRNILIRRMTKDQKPKEIAALYAIEPSYIFELHRRAKKHLKDIFEKFWVQEHPELTYEQAAAQLQVFFKVCWALVHSDEMDNQNSAEGRYGQAN
jgi:RNA polymerase sigma factor (sigma-70 family)